MMIDGVIFDVDGTLWDSTDVVKDAWNQALLDNDYGFYDITADRLKGLFGLPMFEILKALMPEATQEDLERLSPSVFSYEHEYLDKNPPATYEGVQDMFKALSKDYPLFIVSNCQSGYIELFLRKTNLSEYVKGHLCPGDTGRLKADNIKQICQEYNLKNAIYIGDTIMDEMACAEAGVPFVYCTYGFGTPKNPDFTIDKPMDLPRLLKKD